MLRRKTVEVARRYAPTSLKRLARAVLAKSSPEAPGARLGGQGIIEDLCFWMADARVDTVLPLQNYFSALYPDLVTDTRGRLHVYDAAGRRLLRHEFTLRGHGLVKLRVGELLRAAGADTDSGYGTLLCDLDVPPAVRETLDPSKPFYFWDRFYIAYQPRGGVPCFVHGVDKTFVADVSGSELADYYPAGKRYAWAPEIPLDLSAYERFSVVVVNRTGVDTSITLTVRDGADTARSWTEGVPARGAHRFTLTRTDVPDLDIHDLRLRLDGIPTRWGRPVVVKEFANGAISAMHC